MARSRHPHQDIENEIQRAEGLGWRLIKGKSHAWGILLCPQSDREGCRFSIYSTPKNAGNHANLIRRLVDRCPHRNPGNSPRGDRRTDANADRGRETGEDEDPE